MADWDDIDRWYESDTFAEDVEVHDAPARGIVSQVATTEPPEPAGLRIAQTVRVRVRKSEIDTRPEARTVVVRANGDRFRIMGAALGSSGKEWLLDCTQEAKTS